MRATDEQLRTVRYKHITVSFLPYLDGGGRGFGQEFIRVVKEKIGPVHHVFEYCAGPAFIGFSLLAHGLCRKLTLADINPDAVTSCQKTIKVNSLENVVSIYLSDGLEGIPATEQWDLVVSNPPHWPSSYEQYLENIRNFDPDLMVHKKFYASIRKFLTPQGSILFQECEDATTVEDFRPMIESNDLRITEVFKARPLSLVECIRTWKNIRKRTRPSAFYFIRSAHGSHAPRPSARGAVSQAPAPHL